MHGRGKEAVYVWPEVRRDRWLRHRLTFVGHAADQNETPIAIAAIDEPFVGVDFEPHARVAERGIGKAVAGAVAGDAGFGVRMVSVQAGSSTAPIASARGGSNPGLRRW